MPPAHANHPLLNPNQEDLDLIMTLVPEGSSLKALASRMGLKCPTIGNRIDRVIDRLREVLKGRQPDPLRKMLADLVRCNP